MTKNNNNNVSFFNGTRKEIVGETFFKEHHQTYSSWIGLDCSDRMGSICRSSDLIGLGWINMPILPSTISISPAKGFRLMTSYWMYMHCNCRYLAVPRHKLCDALCALLDPICDPNNRNGLQLENCDPKF